jgi:hypothetical protein
MTMCDWWTPGVGDHDKPFEFGRPDHLLLRFQVEEVMHLERLRRWVQYERTDGRVEGPAYHDISADTSGN